jgi:hypothetical protein
MTSDAAMPAFSRALHWGGWVLTVLPVLLLLLSAAMKFLKPPDVMEGFVKLGYPEHLAMGLGIVELTITLIYLVPRTAVLGAVLLTGYLGGAIATHVRIGDPFYIPMVLGLVIWGGLFLREPRLWALLPLRR